MEPVNQLGPAIATGGLIIDDMRHIYELCPFDTFQFGQHYMAFRVMELTPGGAIYCGSITDLQNWESTSRAKTKISVEIGSTYTFEDVVGIVRGMDHLGRIVQTEPFRLTLYDDDRKTIGDLAGEIFVNETTLLAFGRQLLMQYRFLTIRMK